MLQKIQQNVRFREKKKLIILKERIRRFLTFIWLLSTWLGIIWNNSQLQDNEHKCRIKVKLAHIGNIKALHIDSHQSNRSGNQKRGNRYSKLEIQSFELIANCEPNTSWVQCKKYMRNCRFKWVYQMIGKTVMHYKKDKSISSREIRFYFQFSCTLSMRSRNESQTTHEYTDGKVCYLGTTYTLT